MFFSRSSQACLREQIQICLQGPCSVLMYSTRCGSEQPEAFQVNLIRIYLHT